MTRDELMATKDGTRLQCRHNGLSKKSEWASGRLDFVWAMEGNEPIAAMKLDDGTEDNFIIGLGDEIQPI